MSINIKDDYGKLAKLLYPSIEASGNVYYGQTKKLTMDEILGKNELNFESHIESFKQGPETYKSYFNWRLGPLHGSVEIGISDFIADNYASNNLTFPGQSYIFLGEGEHETGPNYVKSTFFAKYNIVMDQLVDENLTYSASFNTYSYSATAVFNSICYTNGTSPTDFNDHDLVGRSFYIDESGPYLYIRILGFDYEIPEINYTQEALRTPLTFHSRMGDNFHFAAVLSDVDDECSLYKYRVNGGEWQYTSIDHIDDLTPGIVIKYYNNIVIPPDGYVEIICSDYVPLNSATKYMLIEGFANDVQASGNINSLLGSNFSDIDTVGNYEFYNLFSNCTMLSTAPILPATNLGIGCYYNMFANTYIQMPPELPALTLKESCYAYMFYGCENLLTTPILRARVLPDYCYASMFDSCTSLSTIYCYADTFHEDCLEDWICDADYDNKDGTLYINPSVNYEYGDSGIPSSWSNVNGNKYAFIFKNGIPDNINHLKDFMLISSGTDSGINGRGNLVNTTLFNMSVGNPFLCNSGLSDSYNLDGSINQDIWGYKSFNSPVSFRNGVYGECTSLTTLIDPPYEIDSRAYNYLYGSEATCASDVNGSRVAYDIEDPHDPQSTVEVLYHPSAKLYSSWADINNYNDDEYGTVYVSNTGIASVIPSENDIVSASFTKEYGDAQQNGSSIDVLSRVIKSDKLSTLYRENTVLISCNANEDGNDASSYIRLLSDSLGYRSSIYASASTISLNSIERFSLIAGEISIDTDNAVVLNSSAHIIVDDDDIDENDFTADKQCLVIGNTKADNSGALVINTSYGYDMGLPIYETIPISSTVTLECNLNDNGGDPISECSISYNNYSNGDSIIEISCSTCSLPTSYLYGDFTVAGDGGILFKITSDELMPSVDVYCDLTIDSGNLTVSSGNVFISGNLTVNGTIIATDQATDLNVSGDLYVTGDTTIDGDLNVGSSITTTGITVNGGLTVTGSTEFQGTAYTRSLLWANNDIRCDGQLIINTVTLNGAGNTLSINKATSITGNVSCSQVLVSGNLIGINGAGQSPYYIGVSDGGVLQFGTRRNNNTITGGVISVDRLNTSYIYASDGNITVDRINTNYISSIKIPSDVELDSNNYTVVFQEDPTTLSMPVGSVVLALVKSDAVAYAGRPLRYGTLIQIMDFNTTSNGTVTCEQNSMNFTVPLNGAKYVSLSPITRYDSTVHKYINIALVMRVK